MLSPLHSQKTVPCFSPQQKLLYWTLQMLRRGLRQHSQEAVPGGGAIRHNWVIKPTYICQIMLLI